MNSAAATRLGIDVGSLYLKMVQIDSDGIVGPTTYRAHQGYPIRCLHEEIPKYLNGNVMAVGLTGALACTVSESLHISTIENESSLMSSVKQKMPEVRNIIDIGGDKLTLIRMNASGELEGITRNSLCAAGTGSFLDEQAVRLDISYHDLDTFPQIENPPSFAVHY